MRLVTALKLLLSTSILTSVNGTVEVTPKKVEIIVITFKCVMLSVGLDSLDANYNDKKKRRQEVSEVCFLLKTNWCLIILH